MRRVLNCEGAFGRVSAETLGDVQGCIEARLGGTSIDIGPRIQAGAAAARFHVRRCISLHSGEDSPATGLDYRGVPP
jgi:hypothetical protein